MNDKSERDRLIRFRKQMRFAPIGEEGQRALQNGKVAIVGVGALGSVIAERLLRAGVGSIRLIDRDWVELDNLPRQTLYTESDVVERLPKAVAAARHLSAIDPQVTIDFHVEDLNYRSVERLLSGVDLVLDGSDNFEVRFLINDYCLEHKVPWVHGGCIGASGQVMLIVPDQTPCFRCLVPELPEPGSQESCDTAGVLGAAVSIVASWQCVEAIRYFTGDWRKHPSRLLAIDAWSGDLRKIGMGKLSEGDRCPTCRGDRAFLRGNLGSSTTLLCGRNSIQVQPSSVVQLDLEDLQNRLSAFGRTTRTKFFVRAEQASQEAGASTPDLIVLTVFKDGRAIVGGTVDEGKAKSLYAQWIGC